jgi:hypothetical protein
LQTVAEFGQGGVGLLGNQHHQPATTVGIHLRRGAAAMGLSRKRARFAAALQQAADPRGAHTE